MPRVSLTFQRVRCGTGSRLCFFHLGKHVQSCRGNAVTSPRLFQSLDCGARSFPALQPYQPTQYHLQTRFNQQQQGVAARRMGCLHPLPPPLTHHHLPDGTWVLVDCHQTTKDGADTVTWGTITSAKPGTQTLHATDLYATASCGMYARQDRAPKSPCHKSMRTCGCNASSSTVAQTKAQDQR